MKVKDCTNAGLLKRFEDVCFMIANYPKNKGYYDELRRVEDELARRLGITKEELTRMRKDV